GARRGGAAARGRPAADRQDGAAGAPRLRTARRTGGLHGAARTVWTARRQRRTRRTAAAASVQSTEPAGAAPIPIEGSLREQPAAGSAADQAEHAAQPRTERTRQCPCAPAVAREFAGRDSAAENQPAASDAPGRAARNVTVRFAAETSRAAPGVAVSFATEARRATDRVAIGVAAPGRAATAHEQAARHALQPAVPRPTVAPRAAEHGPAKRTRTGAGCCTAEARRPAAAEPATRRRPSSRAVIQVIVRLSSPKHGQ